MSMMDEVQGRQDRDNDLPFRSGGSDAYLDGWFYRQVTIETEQINMYLNTMEVAA